MTTPELAAKWGVEPSELGLAFDFLDAHHMRFVAVIGRHALALADPATTKVLIAGEVEAAAAPVVGVSPATLSLILQVIAAVYPLIAQILSIFLGSLAPKPAPTPPAPKSSVVAASVALLVGLVLLCAGPARAAEKCTEASVRAKAALALHLALNSKEAAPVSADPFRRCVCTSRGAKCGCSDCDCNCPDANSYDEALSQSTRQHTPIAVWVGHPIDRSAYPEAVHVRDDGFSDAKPGLVVGVWRDGDLGRVDIPVQPGQAITRERVLAAIGYSRIPASTSSPGQCLK